jgi:hypothetical protein
LQNEIEDGVSRNKFNFDNIITVFHIENVKNIFHHLYGAKTDFDGYISKFITGKPFEYSLQKISYRFVKEYLSNKFDLYEKVFDIIGIGEVFDFSIRMKLKLIDNFDKEIVNEIIDREDVKISTVNSFTRFLVLLKRLNVDFMEIRPKLTKINSTYLLNLLGVGLYFGKLISVNNEIIRIPEGLSSSKVRPINVSIDISYGITRKISVAEIHGGLSQDVLLDEIKTIYDELSSYVKA